MSCGTVRGHGERTVSSKSMWSNVPRVPQAHGAAWGAWMVHRTHGGHAYMCWWAPGTLKGAWDVWVRSGCMDGLGRVCRGQDMCHHGAP